MRENNRKPSHRQPPPTEHNHPAPVPPTGGGQAAGETAETGTDSGPAPLPCLNSNNCTETPTEDPNPSFKKLPPYEQKKTFAVRCNAEKFITETGIERVGFLTLTFPDRQKDHKEAARRWKSMRTHFFSIFGHWQLVKERTSRGYLHFHLLVDLKTDIRTGFDFELYQQAVDLKEQGKTYRHIERQAFRTANPQLRNLWATFRQVCPLYGFGRHELLPIRTTAAAAAKYVGKYVGKHQDARKEEDKGARTYARSQGQLGVNCRLAWNSEGGKEWRRKLAQFADRHGCVDLDAMKEKFGPKWAYYLCDVIALQP